MVLTSYHRPLCQVRKSLVRTALLVIHVASGVLGLGLGPVAMLVPKRRGRHTRVGWVYQWATAGLCLSAIGLVILKPTLWWLGIIAVLTEAAALGGLAAERRRPAGWLPIHISLMCGSYVSFVTAFLVVNLGLSYWPAWLLPSLIGSPLIARAAGRHPQPTPRPV
jgi:hypothetical protein